MFPTGRILKLSEIVVEISSVFQGFYGSSCRNGPRSISRGTSSDSPTVAFTSVPFQILDGRARLSCMVVSGVLVDHSGIRVM